MAYKEHLTQANASFWTLPRTDTGLCSSLPPKARHLGPQVHLSADYQGSPDRSCWNAVLHYTFLDLYPWSIPGCSQPLYPEAKTLCLAHC